MELKVVCHCGQKYKFDVQPVNRQMPFKVACPVCGLDGTGLANNLLLQMPLPAAAPAAMAPPIPVAQLVSVGAAAPAVAAPVAMAAPVAVAAAAPAAPAMAAPAVGGLRINKQHAPAGTPAPAPVVAQAAAPAARPAATPAMAPRAMPKYMKDDPSIQNNSFLLGTVGALLGAVVAVALMYGFYAFAGFKFPLAGTAMGAIIGLGARLMYRGTDSTLGGMSAAVAFFTIGGTLFFMFGLVDILLSGFITMVVGVGMAFKIASG